MKKFLIFIVIVALLVACWVIFFSVYDFDSAEQTLVDSSYAVDRTEGTQLVDSGVFSGALAEYASSVGSVMVAFNGGSTATASILPLSTSSYNVNDVQVLVAVELTSLGIVSDITALLTSGDDISSLAGDIDLDILLELADDFPVICELADWVLTLSDSEINTLIDRIEYSVSGTTILVGTANAIALIG